MENSALNKAHQQHRKAESHLKHRRFNEAIECHKNAAEFLKQSLKNTENPKALESIRLQIDFHQKQGEMLLIKQQYYENYKRMAENNNDKTLQVAIYSTIEAQDSLLEFLIKNKEIKGFSDSDSLKSCETTDTDEKASSSLDFVDHVSAPLAGTKHPKDDQTVIEELRTLNEQLHGLVSQLVEQLDASSREVDALKGRIRQLEGERSKAQTQTKTTNSSLNNLKVNHQAQTDSSGATSPFVFSPCSEFPSGDANFNNFNSNMNDLHKLPVLAPLEMPPTLDLMNFTLNKNVTNTSTNSLGKI